ncbi:FmdB family zinc ribbon protein [Saccharothrix algeriensis]|uniref:FmdB family regulatory protein n=1 Tax=Saccharothrix algeriensis TaxID=173560 RepID=A0A8T8HTE8_9PSEU|nr:zinc ribbon domain-containing protein [Saccharothrix algeriensis]MBM7813197.1 putative FmdB family regulatory protein [Saccharothrix algeriensis]QTR01776.1 zinc ribbon domain-containing protein [Saccharothrix algeriensis]
MPTYEFRCKACGSTFDVKRPMSEASAPATCPHGHDDTVKLLSVVGLGGAGAGAGVGLDAPASGGGCCGGGCCG